MQYRPAEELLWLLSRLVVFCRERDVQVARQFGISLGELHCLQAISHDPQHKIKELTRRLGLSGSRLSRILDKLEERGLVVRSIDRRDHRNIHVALTDRGVEFVRQLESGLIRFYYPTAETIASESTESMIQMLRQILDSFTRELGRTQKPEVIGNS